MNAVFSRERDALTAVFRIIAESTALITLAPAGARLRTSELARGGGFFGAYQIMGFGEGEAGFYISGRVAVRLALLF